MFEGWDAIGWEPYLLWLAGGMALMLLELTTGSLFLVWPGAAALMIALLVALAPGIPVAAQLAIFATLAIALTLLGRGYFGVRGARGASAVRPDLNERGAQMVGRRVRAKGGFANGEGVVRLDDGQWRARLERAEIPDPEDGAQLVIRDVDGATLIVAPTHEA